MEEVKVIILEGGKTCREVNPYSKPIYFPKFPEGHWQNIHAIKTYEKLEKRYNAKESSLRTFEIETCDKVCECDFMESIYECKSRVPGTIHSATINDKKATIK